MQGFSNALINMMALFSAIILNSCVSTQYNINQNIPPKEACAFVHEIFHTFGFSHPKGLGGSQGIMKYPPSKPTKADALELSTTKFLPSIKK